MLSGGGDSSREGSSFFLRDPDQGFRSVFLLGSELKEFVNHCGVFSSLRECGRSSLRVLRAFLDVLEGVFSVLGVLLGQLSNSLGVFGFLESKFLGQTVLLKSSSLKGYGFSLELISNLFGDSISFGLLFFGLSFGLSFSGMGLGNGSSGFRFGSLNSSSSFLGSSCRFNTHLGNSFGGRQLSLNNLLGMRDMFQGVFGRLVHLFMGSFDDVVNTLSGFSGFGSSLDCVVNC